MTNKTNHPAASSDQVRERRQAEARRDTKCEKVVRSAVHALGFRYRIHQWPELDLRREADLVFRRAKVAVFVGSCFWHGCPEHHTPPTTDHLRWEAKTERNRTRDKETAEVLTVRGWAFARIWEHEEPFEAANRVYEAAAARRSERTDSK